MVTKRGADRACHAGEPAPYLEGSVTALVAGDELIAPLADWDGE